ncbi:hypothetical protein ACP70R_046331 [Stipagrostis hirtigluma subsp. patula]
MAARAPPPLLEEIVEEILLRTPPDEPERLVRAALACKKWCRLVSGPGFRRRFRERHRTPPLLGILRSFVDEDCTAVAQFVPTSSFRPPHADRRGWRAIDSRHGRVLLHTLPWFIDFIDELAVWDPVTDEQRELPRLHLHRQVANFNAAVVCAAAAGDCDHLDCSNRSFHVAFVGTDLEGALVSVYSSEAGAWCEPTFAPISGLVSDRVSAAHVGNALYFLLRSDTRILKCDLGTQEMMVINPPPMSNNHIVLMTAEGGGLGCVTVTESALHLWSRVALPGGDMEWVQSRVIEERLAPVGRVMIVLHVVGFADGGGIIYVGTDDGSFTTDLKSGFSEM